MGKRKEVGKGRVLQEIKQEKRNKMRKAWDFAEYTGHRNEKTCRKSGSQTG